ncbi:MAG: hypothetical protein EXR77_10900 [Myxococcales bacterium]|nr:hypothetical protein [Myxococcales bacterium]
MNFRTLMALAALSCACRTAPVAVGESANLAQAKKLVGATAADMEQLAVELEGADADKKRQAGARLRRALEVRRQEGETVQRALSEEERVKLREFGQQRLRPAVLAVERKLGLAPQASSAPAPEPAPAPTAVTTSGQ